MSSNPQADAIMLRAQEIAYENLELLRKSIEFSEKQKLQKAIKEIERERLSREKASVRDS